jgi:hypothetical protein
MKKITLPFVIVFLLLILQTPDHNQQPAPSGLARASTAETVIFEPLSHLGGWISAGSVVEGDYAYVGIGQELAILDISNPAQPTRTGYVTLSYIYALDNIEKSGSYVFASTSYKLFVIDVANVTHPMLVGVYTVPDTDEAFNLALSGDYVYLGCWNSLRVIDISDPENPQLASIYENLIGFHDVAVIDHYAYLALDAQGHGDSGLAILDVSNPISPTLVSLSAPQFPASRLSISGNYAYVTEGYPGGGLHIFDISDPHQPVQTGIYEGPAEEFTYSVAIKDQVAYLISNDNGLLIINVSDPTNPALISTYDPLNSSGATLSDITILGNYAYLSTGNPAGLLIADITDPASPTTLGVYRCPGMSWDVAVFDHYAYVLDVTGVSVVDISEPTGPIQVGHLGARGGDGRIALHPPYAYLADLDAGLRIIDISSPADPVEIGHLDTPGYAYGVDVEGNAGTNHLYAYVADATGGLRIIDVTNPISPTEVGFLTTEDMLQASPRDVVVIGKYAYLACIGQPGLRVVNVSDPTHPSLTGYLNYANPILAISVLGKYVYLAAFNGYSLRILDISNPVYPQGVGNGTMPGYTANDVKVTGNAGTNHLFAYLAGTSGISIFDVSDPSAPELLGTFDSYGGSSGLDVKGNSIYVASGFYILRTLREKLTVTIPPSGGALIPDTSPVEIVFPSGAFTQTAQVTYRHFLLDENTASLVGIHQTFELSAVLSGTFQSRGTIYCTPTTDCAPTTGQTFTMTMPYTATQLGPVIESTLAFYYWDGTQWVRDPNSHLDMAQHILSLNTDRFTMWAVLGETRRVYLPVVSQ